MWTQQDRIRTPSTPIWSSRLRVAIIVAMPRRWTADGVFVLVRDGLVFFSKVTGRTYVEMNIIAYFMVIPCSWLVLLDKIIGTRGGLTLPFLLAWLCFLCLRKDFRTFSEWLFRRSVDFLLFFNRFGSHYVFSSVLICVLLPILIYAALFAALWLI